MTNSEKTNLYELMKNYPKLKKEPAILILGLDNAGKTTLLNYLVHEDNKKTQPTQGVNGKSIQCCGITLNVYDLGGQKAIREYWKYYYEDIDALIYVVDGSDEGRIAECNESFQELLKEEKLQKIPVLVYGNKADLENCLGPDEIIEKLNMNDITGIDWSLYACSALKGTNVKDGIKWIFEKLSSN